MIGALLVGVAAATEPLPQLVSAPATPDRVRLVFVGDTGKVPDGEACVWRADGSPEKKCHISVDQLASLRVAIRAEQADGIYALGDLTYWRAPACRTPSGPDMTSLASTIGAFYADLGAPVYLVLGNHDKAQKRRAPKRVRCLIAFAEAVDTLVLPAEQYVVDHGSVQVLVMDTNRRDTLPSDTLRALIDADQGWVVVAAHHELRTAFDKDDLYSRGEFHPGRWLSELGIAPDLWTNGHAHLLQLGTYDARVVDGDVSTGEPLWVSALTSGSGSKLRAAPTCAERPGVRAEDRLACTAADPRGMPAFAMSRFGYAVVDLTEDRMDVRIVDFEGQTLFRWGVSNPP